MSFINVESYFTKDVLRSPMKASAAPLTAVFLQPKWSVNMLTTGEHKKIMPMAKAPTQAAEKETIHHQLENSFPHQLEDGVEKIKSNMHFLSNCNV